MVGFNIAIPLFYTSFVLLPYTSQPLWFYTCLGEEHQLYFLETNKGSFKNNVNNVCSIFFDHMTNLKWKPWIKISPIVDPCNQPRGQLPKNGVNCPKTGSTTSDNFVHVVFECLLKSYGTLIAAFLK